MYLTAIQLFVFIPILGRSLKPSRSVQCRHWWYLGPSNLISGYFMIFLVGDCDEWTKVHTRKQTWNPQTLFCFSVFLKYVSPYLLLGVEIFRFNDFTVDKELHHSGFSLQVVDSLFRNANVKLRRQCPGFWRLHRVCVANRNIGSTKISGKLIF